MNQLNLGCGQYPKAGFVNVDVSPTSGADVLHDLDVFPYPFKDNEFGLVEADHVLEHLQDPFRVMREIHRIAAPGATVRVRVPHFSRGFTHAQHRRGFDVSFPLYFNPRFHAGYQGAEFRLRSLRLQWFAQPHMKKDVMPAAAYHLGRGVGCVIDVLANLSPWLCSRCWCFVVGGFEELAMEFSTCKPTAVTDNHPGVR